jgi:transcriptional regulator with XRE-family HTH domain
LEPERPSINDKLRDKRLAIGMTESQVAAEVARLVSAETGRGAAIDGNYVSKLERGKITWPNSAYRRAFREIFEAETDGELGFFAMRTRRDAEHWLSGRDGEAPRSGEAPRNGEAPPSGEAERTAARPAEAAHPPPQTQQHPQPQTRQHPPRTQQQTPPPAPPQAKGSVSTSGALAADETAYETRRTVGRRRTSVSWLRPNFRLRGIRWVPVLLAALAATAGWLAYSTALGHNAASAAHHHSYQADGLRLAVDAMTWISGTMKGLGQSQASAAGLPTSPALLPGTQSAGNNRLHLEVDLENITSRIQNYNSDDFRVIGPGGRSWSCAKIAESSAITRGSLQPGYKVTLDVYFDIPANQDKGLWIQWSRHGHTVNFPVNTSGASIAPM